ncbi:MAG TPA: NAD-dependent epimerase/dehydratase family protein [Candidatus Acidoferrales bacterium]|nr:NAD-dependent epimerase/dehydratase family protein [Candidatus Acidoferrales bacterium]
MKVLITGRFGFLGSYLAIYLRERGHAVVAMDYLIGQGSESNIVWMEKNGIAIGLSGALV